MAQAPSTKQHRSLQPPAPALALAPTPWATALLDYGGCCPPFRAKTLGARDTKGASLGGAGRPDETRVLEQENEAIGWGHRSKRSMRPAANLALNQHLFMKQPSSFDQI